MTENHRKPTCASVLETLDTLWSDGSLSSPGQDSVTGHLEGCPECRGAAESLYRIDASLRAGFHRLQTTIDDPTREQIESTIRRVQADGSDAELIRKIRRPFRVILWGAFYAFTLVGCCLLAHALYKAIQSL